jgi:formate/nitrite transporter FocA (FNT family)
MNANPIQVDAIPPRQIAELVKQAGVAKATTNLVTLFLLAVLAGAYISLGAMLYIVVMTNSNLGWGVTRLIGGASFSLGLILVIVGGAELFTGNNLIAMAWASRLISFRQVIRNWLIVYVGNVVDCLCRKRRWLSGDSSVGFLQPVGKSGRW